MKNVKGKRILHKDELVSQVIQAKGVGIRNGMDGIFVSYFRTATAFITHFPFCQKKFLTYHCLSVVSSQI